jgi:hypothetical protein
MMEAWKVEGRRRVVEKVNKTQGYSLRTECVKWCAFDHDFEYHVTIQTNESLSEVQLSDTARRFAALINSSWLGKRWSRFPAHERVFFVATAEDGTSGGNHLHLLLRMPRRYANAMRSAPAWLRDRAVQERALSLRFTALGRAKYVCSHGDVCFRKLEDEGQRLAAASYVFKRFRSGSNLILSTQFDPARY